MHSSILTNMGVLSSAFKVGKLLENEGSDRFTGNSYRFPVSLGLIMKLRKNGLNSVKWSNLDTNME